MNTKHLAALLALTLCGAAGAATDWRTTLLPRDLDGNAANGPEAYYDTVQKLTWLADWRLSDSATFAEASAWADALALGGKTDWRLPAIDLAAPCQARDEGGGGCRNSELGRLRYEVLGITALTTSVFGPFTVEPAPGAQPSAPANTGYWLAPAPTPTQAWTFNPLTGFQARVSSSSELYSAIAVRPGDTPPIPEPTTAALLVAGLGVLALRARRRAQA